MNYFGEELYWRAVEAIAHQWAEVNPGKRVSASLKNLVTGYSGRIQLHSNDNGKLTFTTLSNLRRSKHFQDDGRDFDGCDVYRFEVIEGGAVFAVENVRKAGRGGERI